MSSDLRQVTQSSISRVATPFYCRCPCRPALHSSPHCKSMCRSSYPCGASGEQYPVHCLVDRHCCELWPSPVIGRGSRRILPGHIHYLFTGRGYNVFISSNFSFSCNTAILATLDGRLSCLTRGGLGHGQDQGAGRRGPGLGGRIIVDLILFFCDTTKVWAKIYFPMYCQNFDFLCFFLFKKSANCKTTHYFKNQNNKIFGLHLTQDHKNITRPLVVF